MPRTGVAWFEVDRADVLAAKRVAMTTAGASFEPCTGKLRTKAHLIASTLLVHLEELACCSECRWRM